MFFSVMREKMPGMAGQDCFIVPQTRSRPQEKNARFGKMTDGLAILPLSKTRRLGYNDIQLTPASLFPS